MDYSFVGVVPYIVAVTLFMQNLDGTAIATALPQIGRAFGVAPSDLGIAISGYLLTVAVFIPISGWMANQYGPRTVFAGAIAVFTLASALCGASTSFWMFLAARIVQGIGAAMMTPVGRMVVQSSTPKPLLMRAMATITWPGLIAPVLGPPVGGFITTYASWRWIFYLNVPIGFVAIALVIRFISNEGLARKRPFDRIGFLLSGTAMGGLMYSLGEVARPQGYLPLACAILVVSVILGVVFVPYARRHPHPILDLSAFKIAIYRINTYASFPFRSGVNAIPFLAALMLQIGFGMTAFHAGSLLLIGAVGDLGMKTVTTPIMRRFGFRNVLIVDCLAIIPVTLAFDLLSPHSADWQIGVVLIGYGICRSMGFTAYGTLAVADVPLSLIGATSTLTSMLTQASLGIGVGYASMVLHFGSWMSGGSYERASLTTFHIAFAAAAVLPACALLPNLMLRPDAGADISR